jgi:UDP-glucose 4-epimerase
MKVLVTGASGFVGKSVVSLLLRQNYEVITIKNRREGNKENLGTEYRLDITKYDELEELERLENFSVVIHCAGLAHQFGKVRDEDFWRVNVVGTENIARLAVKLKTRQFILLSSVSVYGKVDENQKVKIQEPIGEKSECRPSSFYAKSKLESERTATEICGSNKISLTILRLATVIGENDPGNMSRLIKIIDNRKFIWLGTGANQKSLIYKHDVAEACLQILENKRDDDDLEIFNITSEPIEMRDIVKEIGRGLDRKIPKPSIPEGFLRLIIWVNKKSLRLKLILKLSATVEKWLSEEVFSGESIARKYGFRPKTPIKEALKKQIQAYQSERKKGNIQR